MGSPLGLVYKLMEIIPIHSTKATNVKNWREIRKEAEELRKFTNEGPFTGSNYNSCYALHHAQVSENPYNFFTINETLLEGGILKVFGSWCIMNAKIVEWAGPVSWLEACMSFPHRKPKRTNRMNRVKVVYYIPFLWTWRKKTAKLEGVMAFLAQHEIEHGAGINIYDKKD